MTPAPTANVVLVGGGQAHVQLIRRWMMRPVPGALLTLVLDRAEALYSGMVPALVSGDCEAHELSSSKPGTSRTTAPTLSRSHEIRRMSRVVLLR